MLTGRGRVSAGLRQWCDTHLCLDVQTCSTSGRGCDPIWDPHFRSYHYQQGGLYATTHHLSPVNALCLHTQQTVEVMMWQVLLCPSASGQTKSNRRFCGFNAGVYIWTTCVLHSTESCQSLLESKRMYSISHLTTRCHVGQISRPTRLSFERVSRLQPASADRWPAPVLPSEPCVPCAWLTHHKSLVTINVGRRFQCQHARLSRICWFVRCAH